MRIRVHTWLSLLALVLVPLLTWGCSDGGSSPTAPLATPGSAVVSGQVNGSTVGSSTQASVSSPAERSDRSRSDSLSSVTAASGSQGVRVRVEGTALSATTDAEGRFLLEGVPSGNVRLIFEDGPQIANMVLEQVQPVEFIELAVRLQGSTVVVESVVRAGNANGPNDGGGDDGGGGGDGGGDDPPDLRVALQIQPDVWNTQWTNSSGTVTARVTGEDYELIDASTVVLVGTDPLADPLVPRRVEVNGGQLRAFFDKVEAMAILDDPQPGEEHLIILRFSVDGEEYELTDLIRIVGPATDSEASIRIEKSTNGVDADRAPGPSIPIGDPVTWEYFLVNSGDELLVDVLVVDDQGVEVTCGSDELAAGASMTCTGEGVAEAGQYANLGTVTAVTEAGEAVSDEDASHYFGEDDPGGGGGEGACGLGYWKNHPGDWPPTGYVSSQTVDSVFVESALVPEIATATLGDALKFGGGSGLEGGARILLKQAVAALLNAAHPGIDYPRSEADVIASVDAALSSNDRSEMTGLADELDNDNEGDCSLE